MIPLQVDHSRAHYVEQIAGKGPCFGKPWVPFAFTRGQSRSSPMFFIYTRTKPTPSESVRSDPRRMNNAITEARSGDITRCPLDCGDTCRFL